MRRKLTCAGLVSIPAWFSAVLSAQSIAFTHATLIDGTGRPPESDIAIVIRNGRIAAVGQSGSVRLPPGTPTLDCSGATVVPGIINLHSHIGEDTAYKIRTFARYGVTTTVGLGGDSDEVLRIRNAQRHGDIRGSRIYTVQQRFESARDALTPEIGRQKVDALHRLGADAVKIVVDTRGGTLPKLAPEVSAAIIDEAHRFHLKVFAHLVNYDDALFLIDHGLDIMAHNVRDREVDDTFLSHMKSRGVTVTATLAGSQSFYVYADSPSWLGDPFFLKWAPPDRVRRAMTEYRTAQSGSPEAQRNRSEYRIAALNLRKMARAGARVGMGNDDGNNPTRFEGFWEHLEMELMVRDAEMTPMQVIQAYSRTNAEALGIDRDYGTLAAGKVADLIVLDKDPSNNILNLRSIRAVYIGGRKFE